MNDMNIYQPQSGDIYEPVDRAQKFREQQNALARQQAVRNALAQSIDPRTGRTNWQQAYAMGGVDVAPELQGMQAEEAQRITREDADYLRQKREQLEMYVNDQASYDAWVADVKAHHPYASFPPTFSPEVKDQLSGFSRRLELAGRTGTGFQTLTPAEEQQLGLPEGVVAQRGPKNDIKVVYKPNMPRAPSAGSAQRAPSGYRFRDDGSLEPIPGGPAAGKGPAAQPTVSEQQAAYSGKRILDAAKTISDAIKKDPEAGAPRGSEAFVSQIPGIRGAVGALQSAPRQAVVAAQRDMLDALLYLATGAAYNKEQLEGQMESYLPAYLDKPETRKSKAVRLRSLIDSAKVRAGRAWTPEMDKALALLDKNAAPADDGKVDASNPLLSGKP